jgi:hypothetical protein
MSDTITEIVKLAEEMIEIDRQIDQLKTMLKTKEDQFKQISSNELPVMMSQVGLSRFALAGGPTIAIKPVLILNVPPQHRMEDVDTWLTKQGHGGMVKTNIEVPFGKETSRLLDIKQALDDLKVDYNIKKTINYMTLNAWGREMEGNNMVIPEDLFNVYRNNITVIEGSK